MTWREFELQTRFTDDDTFGHVNNAIYFTYFENARALMYRSEPVDVEAGFWGLLTQNGARPVVGAQRIEYRTELVHRWDEPVVVRCWVARIGSSSHAMHFELRNASRDTVHAIAEAVMVKQSVATGRGIPLTDVERVVLESWSAEPLTFRG